MYLYVADIPPRNSIYVVYCLKMVTPVETCRSVY